MSDEDERIRTVLHRRRDLQNEMTAIDAELGPILLKRLVATAKHIDRFDDPSDARIGGALWHAARCTDPAGKRLRDALGACLFATDPAAMASIAGEEMLVLLYLGRVPDPDDLMKMEKLKLKTVFPPGRWRPCALYSGIVAPERLVPFVLTYGGDCFVSQPRKRATASKDAG